MTQMPIELDVLTREQAETAREWRNQSLLGLRTPFLLTPAMQMKFFDDVVDNRQAPHRYWALMRVINPQRATRIFVGMTGLADIQWENGIAEISLLTDPAKTRQGIGAAAVDLVLEQAFGRLRLSTVFGECYEVNPAVEFWKTVTARYRGELAILPRRKFWDGQFHDGLYFSISVERWREVQAERMVREFTDAAVPTT